jgi:hypothetical protein
LSNQIVVRIIAIAQRNSFLLRARRVASLLVRADEVID